MPVKKDKTEEVRRVALELARQLGEETKTLGLTYEQLEESAQGR